MTWINVLISERGRWVLLIVLVLFFGVALGFKLDREAPGPSEAEIIEAAEALGYVSADAVGKIQDSLVLSHAIALDEQADTYRARLASALESQEARIVAQIRGELGWAPAVVRRQEGRETLTECEGRVEGVVDLDGADRDIYARRIIGPGNETDPPADDFLSTVGCPPCDCGDDLERLTVWLENCETARGEALRLANDPCKPGEVQIRGSCAVEVIETTETGHQMGAMMWEAHVRSMDERCDFDGCEPVWQASRGPELVPDVTFKLARTAARRYSLWADAGLDTDGRGEVGGTLQGRKWGLGMGYRHDFTDGSFSADVGPISPEPFSYSADRGSWYGRVSRKIR